MRYGTVCSGIEAPSVAWKDLGWEAQWFSEIESFPKLVLAHHYPDVPDLGNMTEVDWNEQADIDVLCGGTPCQSFSYAGLREGLDDDRGNLALEFIRIVDIKRPKWVIWENVPGVLSSNGGRDFGSIIGALAKLGYAFAWRVFDAQYFGVPQRRRRVFLVASSREGFCPGAVLFDSESLSGNPAPIKKEEYKLTAVTGKHSHWDGGPHPSLTQANKGSGGIGASNQEIFSQRGGGLVPCWWDGGQTSQTLDAVLAKGQCMPEKNRFPAVISLHTRQDPITAEDVSLPIETKDGQAVQAGLRVRRLLPVECERLMGFPDDYTAVPNKHGRVYNTPRYKAIGNSIAVPVLKWIGERIQEVENEIVSD